MYQRSMTKRRQGQETEVCLPLPFADAILNLSEENEKKEELLIYFYNSFANERIDDLDFQAFRIEGTREDLR